MGSKCVFGVSGGVSVSRNRLIFLLQCALGTAEWLNRSASADGGYNRNTTSKHGQGWSEVRTCRRSLQKHGSVASSLPVSCRRPTMALRRSGVRLPLSPPSPHVRLSAELLTKGIAAHCRCANGRRRESRSGRQSTRKSRPGRRRQCAGRPSRTGSRAAPSPGSR